MRDVKKFVLNFLNFKLFHFLSFSTSSLKAHISALIEELEHLLVSSELLLVSSPTGRLSNLLIDFLTELFAHNSGHFLEKNRSNVPTIILDLRCSLLDQISLSTLSSA